MGQNYTKYCQVNNMLKDPAEFFEATQSDRQAVHGPSDFALVVKGIRFQCHKSVLMAASRYFETMLTMFDERLKSEVELKDIVEPATMALALHFIYDGNTPMVRKRILKRRNVDDLMQLAIYLQIDSLQTHCCKFIQERLDKKNCIPRYQQTLEVGPFELQCMLEDFILQHFEVIHEARPSAF